MELTKPVSVSKRIKPQNDSFDYISFSLSPALFFKIEYNSGSCKKSEKTILLN